MRDGKGAYMMREGGLDKTLHVVIAGATGAVGRCVLQLAASLPDARVTALTRRAGAIPGNGVREVVFDFDNPAAYEGFFRDTPCDILILSLGTTTKAAGKAGVARVEGDYPSRLAHALAKARPGARIGLVSSVGADRPAGNYLKAKAHAEKAVMESGAACAIARPSFLLSQRAEFRLSEVIVAKLVAPQFLWFARIFAPKSRRMWKYAPVRVEDVADSLLSAVLELKRGEKLILEGLDLQTPASGRAAHFKENA